MEQKEPSGANDSRVQCPDPNDAPFKRWPVGVLLGEAREAIIEHDGQDYRLRITANNKLILTK